MKLLTLFLGILLVFASFSFTKNKACAYADSNIGYVKTQTEKALESTDLNAARYHTYKALNAIEKSRKQLESCGCEYATRSIYDGLENLKDATRTTSLSGTKILLAKALENTISSLELLEKHELHNSQYASDVLEVNTKNYDPANAPLVLPKGKELQSKIDQSLTKFQNSLQKVVTSVPCDEAHDFADRIYKNCENQLLNPNLSEGKKYYNFRVKQIVSKALEELGNCK
ncbi:hypothetical protein K8352_02500 [Flavobacteriaceae bacterium F89]|uniref:Uncharacterized protein n=1 Tax=Cerina litoralis TaxID=2874477 RepID=A0AAE3JMA7_9FLAO|nr:hypothetical protein [Cerina litoralis]MCG2459615.1 hypothetical protein [Cerina litoralis]